MKTCKKNFWKILIFWRGFCNMFESSTAHCKVAFLFTSQERSSESFIKISSLVSKIFKLSWLKGFQFQAKWKPILAKIEIPWNRKLWISWKLMKIFCWNFYWHGWHAHYTKGSAAFKSRKKSEFLKTSFCMFSYEARSELQRDVKTFFYLWWY